MMVSVHCCAAAILAALASVLLGVFFVDPWLGILLLSLVALGHLLLARRPVKHFDVAALTDTSEEIDDEFALHFLGMQVRSLLIIFVNGKQTAASRKEEWMRKFGSLFPSKCELCLLTINEVSQYTNKNRVIVQNVLQIAPLNGDGDKLKNIRPSGRWFFAGDFPTPEGSSASFNTHGSEDVLQKQLARGTLVTISSKLMAESSRPTPTILKCFPPLFMEEMLRAAFSLLAGRMNPGLDIAKRFAEGLVHLVPGTRGANWISVEAMFLLMYPTYKSLNEVELKSIPEGFKCLAHEYFKDIYGVDYLRELKYGQASVDSLSRIIYALDQMMPGIWKGRTRVIYSDDEDIKNVTEETEATPLRKAFEAFCKRVDDLLDTLPQDEAVRVLNPLYDLFAACHMLSGVNTSNEFNTVFQTR